MEQEIDFIEVIKENKGWIVAAAAVSAACGLAYGLLMPPQYEAVADIQMASVAGTMVEAPAVLAEKLKLPLYFSGATLKSCEMEESPLGGKELSNRLKPSVNKNAPFVSIQFRGKSAAKAKTCLASIVGDIQKRQELLAHPSLEVKKNQLNTLEQKLAQADSLRKSFPVENLKFNVDNSQFSAAALMIMTSLSKDSESKDLRNQLSDLQIALKEPQTKETQMVTEIYAPDVNVGWKWWKTAFLGAIAGGLLAVMFFLARKMFGK